MLVREEFGLYNIQVKCKNEIPFEQKLFVNLSQQIHHPMG